MEEYYVVGGCHYRRDYKWIAYPLSSSPHGGIWNKLPKFYHDYAEEKRKRWTEETKKDQDKRANDFFRNFERFFNGFYGFDSGEEPEKAEPDYPFCVFGLKKSSSKDDLKKAYRKSILESHPDKGGTAEAFRKVQEAWECIKSKFWN